AVCRNGRDEWCQGGGSGDGGGDSFRRRPCRRGTGAARRNVVRDRARENRTGPLLLDAVGERTGTGGTSSTIHRPCGRTDVPRLVVILGLRCRLYGEPLETGGADHQ